MSRNHDIIEAMVHAAHDGNQELVDELAAMADEDESGEDVDDAPIDPEAKKRVAEWLLRKTRESLNQR